MTNGGFLSPFLMRTQTKRWLGVQTFSVEAR
jgi:hypothetical protein